MDSRAADACEAACAVLARGDGRGGVAATEVESVGSARLAFFGVALTGVPFTGVLFTGVLFTGLLFAGLLFTGVLFTGLLFTGVRGGCAAGASVLLAPPPAPYLVAATGGCRLRRWGDRRRYIVRASNGVRAERHGRG